MYTIDVLKKMYTACGFRISAAMAHRIMHSDVSEYSAHGCYENNDEGKRHAEIAFERKMWRAKRIAHLIACLPFVRAVAICNSLALHMAHEESDIDFFIITAQGRAWSARWWVTGVLALLRLRPGEAYRDPVCLSFFADESVTDVSHLMIEQDIYFYFWLRSLLPIVGNHTLFQEGGVLAPEFRVTGAWVRYVQRVLEFFASFISESFVKKQQLAIMPQKMVTISQTHPTDVVLSDTIIKLHDQDRRRELRDAVFPPV